MSTAGIFNTSNFAPRQLAPSFSSNILRLMPNGSAPLFAMTSQLREDTITNVDHSWFFSEYVQPQVTTTSALPAAGQNSVSQFTVQDTAFMMEGMVLVVPGTMEQLLIVGIVGNTIAVRRGVGTTAPAAVPAGVTLMSIGTAFEESSLRPLPQVGSYTEGSNTTQIFRNTWAVSGTAKSLLTQVGDGAAANNKRDAAMYHARDIELSILFGEKYKGQLKGQPLRKMGGIYSMLQQYAPQNIVQAPRTTTYDALEAMLDPMFNVVTDQSQMNDRIVFGDSTFVSAISKLGRLYTKESGVSMSMQVGSNRFGQRFTEFSVGRGNFKVMEHPLFNTLPFTRGMGMVVDLSSLSVAYLQGRKTDYKDFNPNANSTSGVAQDNGIDAQGGAYLTEMTVAVEAPLANGIIMGLCEVGTSCAPCVTNVYGSIEVDKPCLSGQIAPNSSVVVTVKSKANTLVKVQTPTGIIEVTTDATGAGTFNYTVGTNESYIFSILPNGIDNIVYSPASASVCVEQPCKVTVAPEQEC